MKKSKTFINISGSVASGSTTIDVVEHETTHIPIDECLVNQYIQSEVDSITMDVRVIENTTSPNTIDVPKVAGLSQKNKRNDSPDSYFHIDISSDSATENSKSSGNYVNVPSSRRLVVIRRWAQEHGLPFEEVLQLSCQPSKI